MEMLDLRRLLWFLFETDAAARRPAIVSRSSRGHLKVTEAAGETPPPKPVELSAGLGPLC